MIRFIPFLAALFIRALRATLRVRHINVEAIESFHRSGSHYLIAFWHCHILMMVFCRFKRPVCVMISQHRDGELIARTMEKFKVGTARGSSTRGGMAALREMIRIAGTGSSLGITPDGPRGPRCVAQIGVVTAAQMTGFPVIPVAFIAEHKRRLRSWDRFEVPRPFSRGMFVYGNPIPVPRELDPAG
ncbi:MAG: lysophospholipid acyltransferase family protein, partial [Thermoanaerobaculia bacterium]